MNKQKSLNPLEIIFATNNNHKLNEIQKLIDSQKIIIKSLSDINFNNEIEETGSTLEENSLIKAKTIRDIFGKNCFADDTGLEIEYLNWAPGVYSARYAGNQKNDSDNISKVLNELEGINNRKARFKTIITLFFEDEVKYFEGIINGNIAYKINGTNGFGYDPIFIPEGYDISFAEMDLSLKNKISHRAIATQKLIQFLNSI